MSALSKVTRDEYLEKWLVVPLGLPGAAGGTTLTNVDTDADTAVAEIPITRNCLLRKVGVGYTSSTGTSPKLTVKAKRGSTVLTSAQATADATAAITDPPVQTFLKKGELLTVAIRSSNDDNDFVNPTAVVVLCPVFVDEDV